MLIVTLGIILPHAAPIDAHDSIPNKVNRSVVRITTINEMPDYKLPWNSGATHSGIGTGFLIADNLIMTNAHVAGDARFIMVEKESDSRQYEAAVKFIAHDCDLAVLEVMDKAFLDDMIPLTLGEIPELDATVTVIGYPIGGSHLSVTRGVVSRIDYIVYSHTEVDSHLAIQIDAAINPGNSGGPVMQNNRVVGVAFQAYSGKVAQNVGYMIPMPVIQRFLADIKDGTYDHYVDLGINFFPLFNKAQRTALGLEQGDYGVMVSDVIAAGAAGNILRVGDVLLTIDDHPIFSNGYVELDQQRVLLAEVVERKFKDDSVRLGILRNRRPLTLTVQLNSPWPYLMNARRHGERPRFVLHGGLLFQPLSQGFMSDTNSKNANLRYYYDYFLNDALYMHKPEVVVLSRILPDPINAELEDFVDAIIDAINDRPIRTLEDVAEAFQIPVEFDVIRMHGRGRPIVLERKAVIAARARILREYGVLSESYLGGGIVPEDWLRSNHMSNDDDVQIRTIQLD